jgi:chemotaxis protein CheZ
MGKMVASKADQDLSQRLAVLRQERGDMIHIDEVGEIVQALLETVEGDVSASDLRLYSELSSLAEYITTARNEIAALRPDEIRSDFIPTATDELDAIVGATETATNGILDACEKLEGLFPLIDVEIAERIGEVTTSIYEACNFQDLTGQRITKVVRVLKVIEERVATLVQAFGHEVSTDTSPEEKQVQSDDDLLNGPQLPGNATDQAEIDRLLAEF